MSADPRHWDVRQEEDAPAYRKIGVTAAVTLAICAALIAWAVLAVGAKESELRPGGDFPESRLSPRPDLVAVQQDLFGDFGVAEVLVEQQRRTLETWGWADAGPGVARVPIDEAMELVLQANRDAGPEKGVP